VRTREQIIEQIKALLAKTTVNGCTEAEELAAIDKAAAMQDAYVVTDAELALTKEEAAVLHADAPDLADPHGIKWRLTYGVSRFCGVQIFRSRRETGLKAIGLPSDVQFAMWLLDHLADFVFTKLMEYLITDCAPRSERRTIIRSFVEGCTSRINDRLLELIERSKAAHTSNGRELVVVKDAAIKKLMKELGIHIYTRCINAPSNISESARAAGRVAGERADFGRPVSGTAGMLRISKA
jgi:hypothetical protein